MHVTSRSNGRERAWGVGDLAHARSSSFKRKVATALQSIEQAAQIGKVGISYSGGKDSTVTLDLLRHVIPDAPIGFYDSGCEYPETYEMIEYHNATIIKPEMSLVEMCKYGGYWGHQDAENPQAEFDFFAFLVQEPSWRFVTMYGLDVMCMGLRGQESHGRLMSAKKNRELYHVKASDLWHLCPIAMWADDDVWAYIASRKLKYNGAYDKMAQLGMDRSKMRVGMLLGMTKPGLQERYSWLRQSHPNLFYQLAADFPKLLEYT